MSALTTKEQDKRILKNYLKVTAVMFIALYIFSSFIMWDTNPANWNAWVRCLFVSINLFTGFYYIGRQLEEIENENLKSTHN